MNNNKRLSKNIYLEREMYCYEQVRDEFYKTMVNDYSKVECLNRDRAWV